MLRIPSPVGRPFSSLRPRRRRKPLRPRIELLEGRLMLAGDLPQPIVVGRTASAWSIADLQDRRVTLTYTVFNNSPDPLTGVVLTDTLPAGVTFDSATGSPALDGQDLRWDLGTIPGSERASVTLTALLTDPAAVRPDSGATAAATINGRAVTDSAPAVTLRADPIPAPLLASTVDANAADPFIQEKAAELDYDPQAIFAFLRDDIGYESYVGSLRGARGALWSGAGNSVDVASLGVALMRASGIPARYQQGNLPFDRIQPLIQSMFPPDFQAVGSIPAGTPVSNPLADGSLYTDSAQFYTWFQFDTGDGQGLRDADPLIAGATPGQSFATPQSTFDEVPDAQRHKARISLDAEMFSQIGNLFGLGGGLSTTTVLDQTFPTAQLVGRPISIGHFVSSSRLGFIFTTTTNTYAPYLLLGDEASTDPGTDELIPGTPYQETLTNFPLGTQVLTGVFLHVTLTGPNLPAETYDRALLDRIGFDIRQNGGTPNIAISPEGRPALTDFDIATLFVLPGRQNPDFPGPILAQLKDLSERLAASDGDPSSPEARRAFTTAIYTITRAIGDSVLRASDASTDRLAADTLVKAYFDRPRLVLASHRLALGDDGTVADEQLAIDLRRDTIYAVPFAGQAADAARAFLALRGVAESLVETQTLDGLIPPGAGVPASRSAFVVLQAAAAQGIPLETIDPERLPLLDRLDLSAEAEARIAAAVRAGKTVIAPTRRVDVAGTPTSAWYEVDPDTGETIAVSEDGGHQSFTEWAAIIAFVAVAGFVVVQALIPVVQGVTNFIVERITPRSLPPLLQELHDRLSSLSTAEVAGLDALGSDFRTRLAMAIDAPLPLAPNPDRLTNPIPTPPFPVNEAAANVPFPETRGAAGLSIGPAPAPLSADQNTPTTFAFPLRTDTADIYHLGVEAPEGWTVSISPQGLVSVLPAGGAAGAFPIRLRARTTTGPERVVEAEFTVNVAATTPGIDFRVDPDPAYAVPFNGAPLPTAFRATIRNLGPAADTFNLSFANIPAGFTLRRTRDSVTVPAGATAVVGLYLVPNPGQPLPAPGTVLPFSVTARSASDASITGTEAETLTVPEIHAVRLVADPVAPASTPGSPTTVTLTIQAVGNVPETITPTANTAGLTLTGLAPVTLQPGQSATQILTLTPDAGTPLNSTLLAAINATFGPAGSPLTQTLLLPLRVVVPGADAIATASAAARALSDPALAGRLGDLATALTNLVQSPGSAVFQGQALANLDSLVSQITPHPFLSGFAGALTTARAALAAATTPQAIQDAVGALGQALDGLAAGITDVARHGFTLSLTPDRQVLQPGAPEVFQVVLANQGNTATTYDLAVSALPAGVQATFSQPSITLQPGQSLVAGNNAPTLTIIDSRDALTLLTFTITATAREAPAIARTAAGQLTPRDESIIIAGVTTNPPFADPGTPVAVAARILGTVNQPTAITATFTVTDPGGNTVFTSPPTPVDLTVTGGLITADLGSLDTAALSPGLHTVTVTLSSGATATATLLIGLPVQATLTTTPSVVPTGLETVTSTATVTARGTFPEPLNLLGAAATAAPGTSVAIFQAGASLFAYESGTGGIDAFDVTDPANPVHLRTFGQGDIVNGQFGFNIVRVVNDVLIVATTTTLNANGFTLLVYSLTDPTSPQLVSSTPINHRFLSDLLVNSTSTAAFVPTNGVFFFGNSISSNFGDFSAIDLSDPTRPVLADTLFNNQGTLNGGDKNQFGGTLVNDQIAYSAGLSPGGGTVIGNHGNLLVVDISDVQDIRLIRELAIPGTINIVDVAVDGNRALVVGTAGIENGIIDFNARGLFNNLSLTVLDITDPTNPVVLGSTLVTNHQFPLNEQGGKVDVVALGNGAFAVSGTAANGQPALAVVNVADPNNIAIGALQVPSFVHGITVSGDKLYATTASGLSIYQILPLVSSPVTISVDLPAGAAADIIPGSFNIPPTRTETSPNGDRLVWDRSFAAGNTTFTFTWQSRVSGVEAGEVVPVTTGAVVSFVDQNTPGSVALPGTAVVGTSIIAITPPTQPIQPGGTATYTVRLTNPTDAAVTYNLSQAGTNFPGQIDLPFTVPVPAHGSVDVALTARAFVFAQPGDATISITATFDRFTPDFRTRLGTYTGTASASAAVAGESVLPPDEQARGVVVQVTPLVPTAGRTGTARYVVRITNTGSEGDNYFLQANGLPNSAFAAFQENFLEVAPGAGNFREVVLLVNTFGADPGSFPFTVTATASSLDSIVGTAPATLNVVSSAVNVEITPSSVGAGGGLSLTVANTGSVTDTFDLSLAGPAALVASLATSQVTLAPGASQNIPITTAAAPFALPGNLDLFGVATSVAQPAVRDSAGAGLTIAPTRGLDASLDAASRPSAGPGTTTFLLTVQNTGNAEDAYTATIVDTAGPLTARLVGLDGLPTTTIPRFRLTALTGGLLTLLVDQSVPAPGTVTLRVQSLNDPSQSRLVTATLTAGQVLPTGTQLLASPPSPEAGQPVTLTATVTADGALPTGRVRFLVDGSPLDPVPLRTVGGRSTAVLVLSSLAPGAHTFGAEYLPDTGFGPSAAQSTSLTVAPATQNPGGQGPGGPAAVGDTTAPAVRAVQRLGFHARPTRLTVAFSEPIDPAGAENAANYRLVGPGRDGRFGTRDDRVIRIRRAQYDGATRTVTLRPARRLPIRKVFQLIVRGDASPALADAAGNRMNAASPFSSRIDRNLLFIGAKVPGVTARRSARAAQARRAAPIG